MPEHIVVIALENKEYGSIIGGDEAPYLETLAADNVLLTHEYAIRHPSLPNYLALTGGSTFGVRSDCTGCSVDAPNIIDQVVGAGRSWKAYMQRMPEPCYKAAFAGTPPHEYAKKHDPFMYFRDIRRSRARCHRIVPFREIRSDLRGGLPDFAWITPDDCFNMHSCPIARGDRWLRRWVPRIMPELGTGGLLMIVFDEGTSDAGCCSLPAGGGHVAAIITGPGAQDAVRLRDQATHYSVLRLIEDAWGLDRLAHASDASTPTIEGWRV
jgi:acid phosphatase